MKRRIVPIALLVSTTALAQLDASLAPETTRAFERYVADVAPRAIEQGRSDRPLPWLGPEALAGVRKGDVVIQSLTGSDPRSVPDGLIHDWAGGVFIPGTTLERVKSVVQDFAKHEQWYPEIVDSSIVSKDGDRIVGTWVLRKKKIITVVLRAELDSSYHQTAPAHAYLVSVSEPVIEIKDYGAKTQKEYPAGQGHGFLWRFNGYWNFHQADGGVYVECRVISLSRDIPTGLGWIVNPFIKSMPRESLKSTLQNTRKAVLTLARNTDGH